MFHAAIGPHRTARFLTALLLVGAIALAAAGTAAAQNEDAYEATIEAPDTVKVGETFNATLVVEVTDPPAEVTVTVEGEATVDGEVVATQNYKMKTTEGKVQRTTVPVTFSEPGQHEVGFSFTGTYFGSAVVGGEFSKTITAVSNVSTRVGDVAPTEPANVTLERSTADIQVHRLEMGASEAVTDVFVEITPSGDPPGDADALDDARRYFTVTPVRANASVFTNVWVDVLVANGTFLPGADVTIHRWTSDGWKAVTTTSEEADNGSVYRARLGGLTPFAVTATGGEEPTPDDGGGDGGDGDGGDGGGQGLPGFGATAVLAALAVLAAALLARRR